MELSFNNKMQIYLLKDLANISGLSIYTIKYYLKMGLVKEIGRTPKSNFRYFDDTTIGTLNLIRKLRLEGNALGLIKDKLLKNQEELF